MKPVAKWLMWPGAHLAPIGLVLAVGVISVGVNALWSPSVEPIPPSSLAPVATTASQTEEGLVAEESLDFIDRPLFWSSRRPSVAASTEEVAIVELVSDEASLEQLEGVQLLGTFGSGDQSGVIITAQEDERDRLYVGDTLNGWTLTEVGRRAAFFESGAGARATIDLAVASNLPKPKTVAVTTSSDASPAQADSSSEGESKPNKTEPVKTSYSGPVTFDSIAQRQRERVEARQKEAAAAAEEAEKAKRKQ